MIIGNLLPMKYLNSALITVLAVTLWFFSFLLEIGIELLLFIDPLF
jgi:hypothetical protein